MIADKLKKSVLQAAIQGKLTEQLLTDGNAKDLLKQIREEKSKLIAEGKIKSEKILPPIQPDEIPFDIPQNWQWVRLGDICEIIGGGTPDKSNPEYWNGNIFWATVADIQSDTISKTELKITNKGLNESSTNIIKSDRIILATRVGLGKVCYTKIDVAINQDLKGITFFEGVNYFYALKFFQSIADYIIKNGTGTTVKGVRLNFIENILFPLPPMDEQKRIVERVEKILSEVELLAESERELDDLQKNFPRRMKNSILQAAIQGKLTEQLSTDGDARELLKKIREEKSNLIAEGKIKSEKILPPIQPDEIPFDIPKNWQWVRLGDICEIIGGGTPDKSNPEYWNGNIFWATVADIQSDTISKTELKITNKGLNESSTNIIKSDRIILATRVGLGKVCYTKIDVAINQDLKGITFFEGVNYFYALKFFQSIADYIIKNGTGTTVKGVRLNFIENILFPLPPMDEQKRIVERLEELLPLCDG